MEPTRNSDKANWKRQVEGEGEKEKERDREVNFVKSVSYTNQMIGQVVLCKSVEPQGETELM